MKLTLLLLTVVLLTFGCTQLEPVVVDDSQSTPQGVDAVANSNNQFAFEIYNNINEGKNVFFSPYSISTAMGIVYQGAKGETASEIQTVFHFSDNRLPNVASIHNLLQSKDSYKLHTANALWAEQTYPFLPEYTSTIEQYYAGKVTNIDFKQNAEESRQTINKWVENKTNNKIQDLFAPGTLPASTKLAITNAIYFKGEWVEKFKKSNTKKMPFHITPDMDVTTDLMFQKGEKFFNYYEDEKVQVLEMDYEGDDISMIIVLPMENDLTTIEQNLNFDSYQQWTEGLERQKVNVAFPKYTFKSEYTLSKILSNMGMPTAFLDGAADFSGMDGTRRLFINVVIHKAFVDVDEEGTEAAAATGISVVSTSVPSYKIFRADHPFLFFIREKSTGIILFMGKVVDPTA